MLGLVKNSTQPTPFNSIPVRLAGKTKAVARRVRGPAARDPPAENRRTQHGAFEAGTAVDMTARHACALARGIEPADRLELPVERAALQVGLHAAEILAREREELNGVVGRRVERLRRLERLAELRLFVEPLFAGRVVALDSREECRDVDSHLLRELAEILGLANERGIVEQLHDP